MPPELVPVKTMLLPPTQTDGIFAERLKTRGGGCEIKKVCLTWQPVRASVTVTDQRPALRLFVLAVVYYKAPFVHK